ncbi:hypothetical protein WH95_20155, partial [Kiloniella litopenaei]
ETITNWVRELVEDEVITDREDLIKIFKEQGFDLARKSKNYISLKPPEGGRNIRLKGIFYNESYDTETVLHEQIGRRETNSPDLQRGKLEELRQRYDRAQYQREERNKRRYGRKQKRNAKSLEDKKKISESESYQTGDLGYCVVSHFGVGGVSRKQNVERSNKAGDRS